ncbi:hypothetical protein MYIN104542_18785 [Mycobacterium intermedium]
MRSTPACHWPTSVSAPATRWCCPASCQSCWANPCLRSTSGNTPRSTPWPPTSRRPNRIRHPKPHRNVRRVAHSKSRSPSLGWGAASRAGSTVQMRCGISCVNAVPRSGRSRPSAGSRSRAGPRRKRRYSLAPPGGGRSCPTSTRSTRSSSRSPPAKPTRWTRSSACCWKWPGKHWSTRGFRPARCDAHRPGSSPDPA